MTSLRCSEEVLASGFKVDLGVGDLIHREQNPCLRMWLV